MLEENVGMIGYLQQRNAINILRALHHVRNPSWSSIREYTIHELRARSISDVCYRRLCKQLVALGLAAFVERDPLKRDYYLTEQGHEAAEIIDEAIVGMKRWRKRAEKEHNKS